MTDSDALALVAFLKDQIAEDEQWALAASAPYPYAKGNPPVPADGVHWTWVAGEHWTPVHPDPVVDDILGGPDWYGHHVNLVSVEEWPTETLPELPDRPMPAIVANSMVEVLAGPAGHIVRHDPARVLREVAAKRRLLDLYDMWRGTEDSLDGMTRVGPSIPVEEEDSFGLLKALAGVYSDRPGFREEWRS